VEEQLGLIRMYRRSAVGGEHRSAR
jgi:hypothetical protein